MKSIKGMLLCMLVLLIVAGCGSRANVPVSQDGNNQSGADVVEIEEAEQVSALVYYADEDMNALVTRERTLVFNDALSKIEAALAALQESPDEEAYSLWEKAVFVSVVLQEDDLIIDLSLPEEARFGAPGEALALQSLEQTLFQFEEIKTLQLLVDGEEVESLMGHEELMHPIIKE